MIEHIHSFKVGDKISIPRVKTIGCPYNEFINVMRRRVGMPEYFMINIMWADGAINIYDPRHKYMNFVFNWRDLELYKEDNDPLPLTTIAPGVRASITVRREDGTFEAGPVSTSNPISTVPSEGNSGGGATRYNAGKAEYSLLSLEALEPMVRVLEFGAKKYAPNNWKKGTSRSSVLNSMLRHISAILEGEENDPESGLPHIAHVQCNAMFLGHKSCTNDIKSVTHVDAPSSISRH